MHNHNYAENQVNVVTVKKKHHWVVHGYRLSRLNTTIIIIRLCHNNNYYYFKCKLIGRRWRCKGF